MLTDVALKCLKPRDKPYKVTDRDGMYVHVSTSGTVTFRLDYRLHGRRETLSLGKYGPSGLSLARAREATIDAKRAVSEGRSPAQDKQRDKRRIKEAKSFGEFGERWLTKAPMADSTRAMRRSIFERELLPVWKNRLLKEITPDDLRAHCGKIVDRGAPATAIHVRDILKQIYGFAILHGERIANPADDVGPASIATFVPKDRSLSPTEIRIMLKQLEHVATLPTIRLGMRLFLLTMVRKSELQDAVWDEVDFENAVWTIPKERMKRSKAHNVYLSRQCLDIMIALKTCAGNSRYLLPSRYDADAPMSRATFNRVADQAGRAQWTLRPNAEASLRAMGDRGDIIRTMHRALARGDLEPDAGTFAIHGDNQPSVLGRLADRGLQDELKGSAYVVIEGTDGRAHHVRFGSLEATGDAAVGAVVEIRPFTGNDGQRRVSLAVRSDLPLEAQVGTQGATWLDRTLIAREPIALAGTGFGADVRDALAKRADHLAAGGLASRQGGRTLFARDLLDTLRRREIDAASAKLSAETGLPHVGSAEGEHVAGVYRQRVQLASGRFAMIDAGLGFELVPWKPALEEHVGRHVSGVVQPGGSIAWSFGRTRGLGIA